MQSFRTQCAWLPFFVSAIAFVPAVSSAEAEEQLLIVTSESGQIKTDQTVLATVTRGTRLWSSQTNGDWYSVKVPGTQQRGWIFNRSVRSIAVPDSRPQLGEIVGWGTVVDPANDCKFFLEREKLTIVVPDGLHDLWSGRKDPQHRFSGPRVVQEIKGDFIAQVRVTADWQPYNEQTNYGAGLLVWDSEKDFVRRERHVFNYRGKPTCFTTPLHFQNDKRVEKHKLADADFFKGRSTWMRVQRAGQKLSTAISHDGKQWIDTGTLETNLPVKVKVGVHVFKVSPGAFLAEFDEFRISKR